MCPVCGLPVLLARGGCRPPCPGFYSTLKSQNAGESCFNVLPGERESLPTLPTDQIPDPGSFVSRVVFSRDAWIEVAAILDARGLVRRSTELWVLPESALQRGLPAAWIAHLDTKKCVVKWRVPPFHIPCQNGVPLTEGGVPVREPLGVRLLEGAPEAATWSEYRRGKLFENPDVCQTTHKLSGRGLWEIFLNARLTLIWWRDVVPSL